MSQQFVTTGKRTQVGSTHPTPTALMTMAVSKIQRTTRSGRVLTIMAQKMPGFGHVHRMSGLLDEAAALIPDIAAYKTLCAQSLMEAWESDRKTGKREAHNRRRAWLRLFRRFARLQGIRKDLRIVATDRAGTYACELIAKPDRGLAWKEFVLRARLFGIYEGELEALVEKARLREERRIGTGAKAEQAEAGWSRDGEERQA